MCPATPGQVERPGLGSGVAVRFTNRTAQTRLDQTRPDQTIVIPQTRLEFCAITTLVMLKPALPMGSAWQCIMAETRTTRGGDISSPPRLTQTRAQLIWLAFWCGAAGKRSKTTRVSCWGSEERSAPRFRLMQNKTRCVPPLPPGRMYHFAIIPKKSKLFDFFSFPWRRESSPVRVHIHCIQGIDD